MGRTAKRNRPGFRWSRASLLQQFRGYAGQPEFKLSRRGLEQRSSEESAALGYRGIEKAECARACGQERRDSPSTLLGNRRAGHPRSAAVALFHSDSQGSRDVPRRARAPCLDECTAFQESRTVLVRRIRRTLRGGYT